MNIDKEIKVKLTYNNEDNYLRLYNIMKQDMGCERNTGQKSIYCHAYSEPDRWDDNWKGDCNTTVVWGYTGA